MVFDNNATDMKFAWVSIDFCWNWSKITRCDQRNTSMSFCHCQWKFSWNPFEDRAPWFKHLQQVNMNIFNTLSYFCCFQHSFSWSSMKHFATVASGRSRKDNCTRGKIANNHDFLNVQSGKILRPPTQFLRKVSSMLCSRTWVSKSQSLQRTHRLKLPGQQSPKRHERQNPPLATFVGSSMMTQAVGGFQYSDKP